VVAILRRFSQVCLPVCMLFAACGGAGDDENVNAKSAAVSIPRPVAQTDMQIAQAVYSDTQRTPTGFYSDSGPAGTVVNTTHITSADIGNSSMPLHELCTDDWTQAYNWSERAAQSNTQYGSMQVSGSTDLFFEFIRSGNTQPAGIWRERIFRCSYVDRDSVDLQASDSHAGQLNRRPITAGTLKELTEYLWTLSTYNNDGNVVLQGTSTVNHNGLNHTLYIASLDSNAGSNNCDRITIRAWNYAVDMLSGELTFTSAVLWSFDSKRTSGLAELCPLNVTQ
jgi:hypothetical protein